MTSKIKKVRIVIINWNQWELTKNCLESLEKLSYKQFDVILIDNASDSDISFNAERFSFRVEHIANKENLGFGKANNQGFDIALQSDVDYIWLLNNDTVVEENTLNEILNVASLDEQVGAVGSVIYDLDNRKKLQCYGGGRVNVGRCYTIDAIFDEQVDYISGVSMLIKREVIEQGIKFDPKFFMYWEDVDFSLEIRKAGYNLGVAEDSIVYHKRGAATSSLTKEIMSLKSALYFSKKHSKNFLKTLLVGFLFDRFIRQYPKLLIIFIIRIFKRKKHA